MELQKKSKRLEISLQILNNAPLLQKFLKNWKIEKIDEVI